MGIKIKFRKKTYLGGLGKLCCWTYEISRDDKMKWAKGETVGIYFNEGSEVVDPANFATCNGYRINPDMATTRGGKTAKTNRRDGLAKLPVVAIDAPSETDMFDISFIATCEESTKVRVGFVEVVEDDRVAGENEFSLPRDTEIDNLIRDEGVTGVNTAGPALSMAADTGSFDTVETLPRFEGIMISEVLDRVGLSPIAVDRAMPGRTLIAVPGETVPIAEPCWKISKFIGAGRRLSTPFANRCAIGYMPAVPMGD